MGELLEANPPTGDVENDTDMLKALLKRRGNISLQDGATYYINDTLVIESETAFILGQGTVLKLMPFINKSLIKNAAFDASNFPVSITSSGRTATVAWTGHGKAVGDAIGILGADQASYNGAWTVASVPDANTLTYEMFEPASATPATGTVTGRAADKNISIIGGAIDMDQANQTVSGTNDTHAVRIFNCVGGRIDTRVINAKKYAVLLANVDQFEVPNLDVDTASDGLHMMGPIGTVDIGTVSGKSGDDLVSVTLGDFSTYEVCRGNARNITIDHIKPRYSLTALKIAGNPNCTVEFLSIGTISGTTRRQSVYFTNDTNLTQTNTERVEIGAVRVMTGQEAANTHIGILLRGGTHKSIKIGSLTVLDNDTTDAVSITDATFGTVEIDQLYSRSTGARKTINIGGAAVIQKHVKVMGIDITQPDSSSAMVVQVGGTATVPRLFLGGVSAVTSGTNARFLQVSGTTCTLTEVVFDGVMLTNGNSLFDQSVAGQPAPIIRMVNGCKLTGYATGLNIRDSATVYLDGTDWGTFSNRPIQTGTAGTVTVSGWCQKTASRLINKGAGATVYANGHTFFCDTAAHQTARNGDMVTDSTSGLVVHYNGAAWAAVS